MPNYSLLCTLDPLAEAVKPYIPSSADLGISEDLQIPGRGPAWGRNRPTFIVPSRGLATDEREEHPWHAQARAVAALPVSDASRGLDQGDRHRRALAWPTLLGQLGPKEFGKMEAWALPLPSANLSTQAGLTQSAIPAAPFLA